MNPCHMWRKWSGQASRYTALSSPSGRLPWLPAPPPPPPPPLLMLAVSAMWERGSYFNVWGTYIIRTVKRKRRKEEMRPHAFTNSLRPLLQRFISNTLCTPALLEHLFPKQLDSSCLHICASAYFSLPPTELLSGLSVTRCDSSLGQHSPENRHRLTCTAPDRSVRGARGGGEDLGAAR